jgi:hypothetical protein
MKRKTTITLTIAGLLGLAGILYSANPSFFSPVNTPIGVAASRTDLIVTEYTTANIDSIDCLGNITVLTTVPDPDPLTFKEKYLAIAPMQAVKAGFTQRDIFVTQGTKIWQVRPPSPPTLFATIPGCGDPQNPDHTGITFDRVGTFGNNMIVTCWNGSYWQVDGTGTPTLIAADTNFAAHPEGPVVAPLSFGIYGGYLWVADEFASQVHVIAPDGTITDGVLRWFAAEGMQVIPSVLCTYCSAPNANALFQAIEANCCGPTGIYQYPPTDFTGLGGNLLVTSEEGEGTALITPVGGGYNISFFDNIPGGIFEGNAFADCDVPTPTPTPTFTPTAIATATFTPTATLTPTATFTPTATATATATPTPTPTAAAIIQVGTATENNGNGTSMLFNKPTGVATGDLMIANIALRGGDTSPPSYPSLSGWSQVTAPDDYEAAGQHRRYVLLYKVATASEPATYTFTITGSGANWGGAIVAFRNVDNSTPFDAIGTYGSASGNVASPGSCPSITTNTANAAVLMLVANQENRQPTSFSTTSPGALTLLYPLGAVNGNDNVGAGWAIKAATGATGAGSFTWTGGTSRYGAILIALKPAP